MATLTLIGEPFPDADAPAHAAAVRDLTRAVAETAPRGCSARLLVARDRTAPEFDSAIAQVESLPMRAGALPRLWRTGATARPLDGEFVHASTPLVPLRSRREDDGSQTSVLVPHALAWQAPELMGATLARQYRAFVRRAVRLADVLLAADHATATVLQEQYGADLAVQVLPLAPPSEYLPADDHAALRAALGLPPRYLLTTATTGEHGRLEVLFDTLLADLQLLPLVVLTTESAREALLSQVPLQLRERVQLVAPEDLRGTGAVITGAELLLMPQAVIGTGFEVLGALAAGIPVVHLGCPAVAELILDAGVQVSSPEELDRTITRLTGDPAEVECLRVLAQDRAKSFSWLSTAWQLWELHANL
ncbi:MAG: mannosyltransferase [Leucobacter sp.]